MENKYKCPCCGYYTFDHVLDESYDICPVCFWEDSYYDYEFPDDICSCNKVSLNQAQANYLKYGACKKELCEYVREPNEEEKAGMDEKNNRGIDEIKSEAEYQPDFIETLDGDQIYNIKDKPEKKSSAEKIYYTQKAIELILSVIVGIILLVSYIKG